jgi:hypothetical protein
MQTQGDTPQRTSSGPRIPRIHRVDYEPPVDAASCPTCGAVFPTPANAPAPATAGPTVGIPALLADPSLRAHVQKVLTLALEVFDGRRNPAQLHALLAPSALRYLTVAARAHRPNRVSRLQSLHIAQPADANAEAASRAEINGRQRAMAVRFDRDDTGAWVATSLRILL